MISPQAAALLENELKSFEQSDSTQIVILTVPSLEAKSSREYGIKVAEMWKAGWKGKDNGVIFLVSQQERKMRIEVGRGLEGTLNGSYGRKDGRWLWKPRFREGILTGVLYRAYTQ